MRGAPLIAAAILVLASCSGAKQALIGGGSDAGAGTDTGSGVDAGSHPGTDATTPGDDESDATSPPTPDASIDVSEAGGGTCTPSPPDGGACNTLVPPTSSVTVQCQTAQPVPVPTGGTILDGTYVMTSATYYADGAACPAPEVDNTMWLVCGTSWQTAQISAVTGQTPYTLVANATVVPSGNTLGITLTCGSTAAPITFGYDASGNTLRLHINGPTATAGRVDTFERQ
jgi:hypothetical protein